ncbi:hypothetical protein [Pseudomonas aeruginosa]|uniref:hypothetical protein n=1 Tax=Pseudomonas aeruginosa TaxID=287 RepID=UPI0015E3D984|nr:hypothetical protein [Pseudomonas aeruginosa]MBA1286430.1 hypothetical protein [Pseudomonas aeruginosa]
MLAVLRDSKMVRAVPRVILWGGVALFLFLILVLAEGSVYLAKVGEARDAAIAQWLNEHPEDAEAVTRYRTVCIGSPVEPDVEKIASPSDSVDLGRPGRAGGRWRCMGSVCVGMIDLVGHASFLLTFLSFFQRSMVKLRLWAIAAGVGLLNSPESPAPIAA